MGLAGLLRQSFLLFVPFALLACVDWTTVRRRFAVALRGPLAAIGIIAVLILPWTLRNYQAFQRLVLLNTNAGFAFYWANHPIYGTNFAGILPPGISYQSLIPAELRSLDEAALESALMQRGVQFVLDDPGRYLLLSISRFKTYFMFWPSADSGLLSNVVRVLSFGLALPFILHGLILALRRWRRWLLLYLFVVVYSGIHLLSWALIRYRLPVDAVLLVFAVYSLVDLYERARVRLARAVAPAAASH